MKTTASLSCAALAVGALALPTAAQIGNVDQHCLRGTQGNVLGMGAGYLVQQQVRAGSSGLLTAVEVWISGNQAGNVAVRVRRGAVPTSQPVLWEQVYNTGTQELDWQVPTLDTSAAGIHLTLGEVFAIELELLDGTVGIAGVDETPPCYPEPCHPVSPALPDLRWAFRTFLQDPAPGTNYCVPSSSTVFALARIWGFGTSSIAADNLQLVAGPMPDVKALFFYGTQPNQTPFGNGYLCLSGILGRLPGQDPHCGTIASDFDLALVSPSLLTPGATLYLQAWFRDPFGGGGPFSFGLSDGYAVTLTP
jgi:hypothetical protein